MLGIDVSKDTLSCALIDPTSRKVQWQKVVKNTTQGWKQLLKATPGQVPWVLEPTGRYGQGVARFARDAGRDVRLAQPKKAQYFLKSVQDRAKTDTLDAVGLALYGLAFNLAPYPLKSDMHEEIDQMLLARKGMSQSLMELRARQKELPRAAQALEPAIAALKEQLAVVDKQIAGLNKTPEMKAVEKLKEVPGIGQVTATTVASCLTSRQFTHPDQFVAYCGLDIRIRQSGRKNGQMGLSKQGESELRRLLYLAAQSSLRVKGSPFKEHYDRERAKGLPSTAALCAVARKMARLCWSMVHNGSSYDADRVYRQGERNPKK